MRSQYPSPDADARLVKLVAAILAVAVAFWFYKQYFRRALEARPAPQSQSVQAPATATPAQVLWSDPSEEASGAEAPPEQEAPVEQAPAQQEAEARLQQEQARLAQALAAENPRPATYLVQPDAAQVRHARCQAAKDHREAVLEQVGLARSYDLIQQLDDQVYEACKGQ